jgi:hypothetical protein
MVVIEPRNPGTATVTVTVLDVGKKPYVHTFKVTVVAPGTNTGPGVGSESTGDVFPDLIGAATAADDKRLKIGETRTVIDGANISTLFADPNFLKSDRLTLSVKYFPVTVSDDEAAMADTKQLESNKAGVSHTLSTNTWDGSEGAKLTLSLTGTSSTPLGSDANTETDDGHLVALIATDTYGESFAHVLRVLVNHRPKAEGAQEDPKTLGGMDAHMDMGFDSTEAGIADRMHLELVADGEGYFHDPDGATNTVTCRITGNTGDAATFRLQDEDGTVADARGLLIDPVKQGTASVTISCRDSFMEDSPEDTLTVKVTHQSISRH